jgi:uncharacterized membrane protein (DUF2068 family)
MKAVRGGRTVELDAQGKITLDLAVLRSVGIANLAQVQSHHITHVAGSTSHVLHFVGGGLLRYAYNQGGDLIELSAYRLNGCLNEDNDLVVSAYVDGQRTQA